MERTLRFEHGPCREETRSRQLWLASLDRALAGADQIVEFQRRPPALADCLVPEQCVERLIAAESGEVASVSLFRVAPGPLAERAKLLAGVFVDAQVHPKKR